MVDPHEDVLNTKLQIGKDAFEAGWISSDNSGVCSWPQQMGFLGSFSIIDADQGVGYCCFQAINDNGLIGQTVFTAVGQPALQGKTLRGTDGRFGNIAAFLREPGINIHRLVADQGPFPEDIKRSGALLADLKIGGL